MPPQSQVAPRCYDRITELEDASERTTPVANREVGVVAGPVRPKVVFVSSQSKTGGLGGTAGADRQCHARALAAPQRRPRHPAAMRFALSLSLALVLLPLWSPAQESRGLEAIADRASEESIHRQIREGVGKTWAVLIANSRYEHWPDLGNEPYDDVAGIEAVLKAYDFDRILVEKDLTMERFRPFLADLYEQLKVNQVQSLLVYYAGHGEYDDLLDTGFWIPVDAPQNSSRLGYLSDTEIQKYVALFNRQTRHVLLLSDSCFSGSLLTFRSGDGEPTPADLQNLAFDAANRSAFGITSGRKRERVANASRFARAFEDVLERNRRAYLRSEDVAHEVGKKVRTIAHQQPQDGPIAPTHEFGQFVFVRRDSGAGRAANEAGETLSADTKFALQFDPESEVWELARNSKEPGDLRFFLEKFPQGRFAPAATLKLRQLQRAAPPATPETLADREARTLAALSSGLLSPATDSPVRQFLSAARAGEWLPDTSAFRKAFVAGLYGGADLDANGEITGQELSLFVVREVARQSPKSPFPQYATIRDPTLNRGDFVFTGRAAELYRASRALVIGVSDYEHWPDLTSVAQDVREVAEALAFLGFEVEIVSNPSQRDLLRALNRFVAMGRNPDSRLLFYFAGHAWTEEAYGVQMGYLVPADAPRNLSTAREYGVSLQTIEAGARYIRSRHVFYALDTGLDSTLFTSR